MAGEAIRRGVVLEGGAMRGMYTAGVLDVLMENGISADGAVGVSAGAVFGCNYKSGQIGRTVRYNMKYCNDPHYGTLKSLMKTGEIYDEQFCYHDIPEKLDPFDHEAFEKNPMKFYVVCTDVRTGKAVYHKCTDGKSEDLKWMQASASMPMVSKIVHVGARELLDGGIADSIPVEWFRKRGYNRNLVILTRPEGYRKRKPKMTAPLKFFLRSYPAAARALCTRYVNYNHSLDVLEDMKNSGEALVIRPSRFIKVSRVEKDPKKLQELYRLGREDAEAQLDQIRSFFQLS